MRQLLLCRQQVANEETARQRTPAQEALLDAYAKALYEGHGANQQQNEPVQVAQPTWIQPREERAARRGDPYAAARVRLRNSEIRINAILQNGQISTESAHFQWRLAHDNYHRETASIEQQRLINEMRQQSLELQRLRSEMEWNQHHHR